MCAAIINLVKTLGKVVLYEAEKGAKLGAMTRGVIDGFRFREGPGAPHHPHVGWVSSQEA